MKTKTLKKYSENFLNNQNYILGKTEKKKLLSKFFVENIFLRRKEDILKIIKWWIIFGYTLVLAWVLLFLNYLLLIEYSISIIMSILISIPLIVIYFVFLISSIKKYNKTLQKIDSNKLLFLDKKSTWYFFYTIINFSIIILLSGLFFLDNIYISIMIFLFIALDIIFFILKINFIVYFFLTLFTIIKLILFPILFLYISLFKWFKGYTYIKNNPFTKIKDKFKDINISFAENKFYKIKLKKWN